MEVNVTCYIYHKGDIEMTLVQFSDYDDGERIPAIEVDEVMGDIKVATFVLKNPKQFNGQSFFCEGSNILCVQVPSKPACGGTRCREMRPVE